ncbi:MAG: glycosyltransferase [Alphaproteobacteria bacterium]|nr:glycosyltransferase [Alphaproteobacteria bacterium]
MTVWVVTPYHREPEAWLRQCCTSVADQSHPDLRHLMVGDGTDALWLDGLQMADPRLCHLPLVAGHRDYGNTPRGIGGLYAIAAGATAIAFLDADNWYRADHLERMLALFRTTGAAVCTAGRTIHRADGSLMYEDQESDGVHHVDTSCYVLFPAGFDLAAAWLAMPQEMAGIGDRLFFDAMRARGHSHAHDPTPTVAYRTNRVAHFVEAGESPPSDAKGDDELSAPIAWWRSQSEETQQRWLTRLHSKSL